jgi:Flp pilus assembly protein TadG
MTRHHHPEHPGTKRPGKALVMFVLLTPALLGMVGLTIDGGLMLVTYRQTQNAADTAALVAATDLIRGRPATYTTSGANFAQNYNMSGAIVIITVPDSGPHSGNSNYAQAIVSYPFQTSFIQVLGVNSSQQVTARAVTGFDPPPAGQNLVFLVE